MTPKQKRRQELEEDFLECLSQFGSVTLKQLSLWMYGDTNPSALTRTHRIAGRLLGQKLVLRRKGGDARTRYVLGYLGGARLGIRAGYALSQLNARQQEKIIEHLTIMHLQGFNIFGRRRIWRTLDKKYRQADGLVLDNLDVGYALVSIQAKTDAIERRIACLREFIEVRAIGDDKLLKKMGVRKANTYENTQQQLFVTEQIENGGI